MTRAHLLPCLILLCTALGCKRTSEPAPAAQRAPEPAPAEQLAPEPWAAQPPARWPQLVLTNEADFRGHSSLHGASAFVVRGPDDKVYIVTALHLIGAAGGVEPEIQPQRLDAVLARWRVFPRTQPDRSLQIARLAVAHEQADWLVLSSRDTDSELPAQPLQFRRRPVQVGERIRQVGCPYAEPDCVQNVYEATVTDLTEEGSFVYELDQPVSLAGFSGAPILDAQGHVVGMMTRRYMRPEGGPDLAGISQPTATLLAVLPW